MSRQARDQHCGTPPRWSRLYAKHCPHNTDGASRHVKVISESLRGLRSPVRRLLDDAGYEPDHWAFSMETTVKALWEARAEIARLRAALPTTQEK